MSDAAASSGLSRRAWIMILTGAVIVTLSMGVRQYSTTHWRVLVHHH